MGARSRRLADQTYLEEALIKSFSSHIGLLDTSGHDFYRIIALSQLSAL